MGPPKIVSIFGESGNGAKIKELVVLFRAPKKCFIFWERAQRPGGWRAFPERKTRKPEWSIGRWSRWSESNRQPMVYDTIALPIELHRQNYLPTKKI